MRGGLVDITNGRSDNKMLYQSIQCNQSPEQYRLLKRNQLDRDQNDENYTSQESLQNIRQGKLKKMISNLEIQSSKFELGGATESSISPIKQEAKKSNVNNENRNNSPRLVHRRLADGMILNNYHSGDTTDSEFNTTP